MPSSAFCSPACGSSRAPCRAASAHGASRRRARGDVLIESLVCLAIVGLGAIPLATLGSAWLRWGGQHERLGATLRLAAEQAEARDEGWRLIDGDAAREARAALCDAASVSAGCRYGNRLALASLPPDPLTGSSAEAMPVTHIGLWGRP